MKLASARVQRYKRLWDAGDIDLRSSLIAIVGPNESGKTSLLQALEHLGHDRAFDVGGIPELTRHHAHPPTAQVVVGRFQIDDADRQALRGIPEADAVRNYVLIKRVDGSLQHTLEPRPVRDTSRRAKILASLRRATSNPHLRLLNEKPESEYTTRLLTDVMEHLESSNEMLSEEAIKAIRSLAGVLRNELPIETAKYVRELPEQLDDLAGREAQEPPIDRALASLMQRVPRILRFDVADRELPSEFTIVDRTDAEHPRPNAPPRGLANVMALAGLDLKLTCQAIVTRDQASVSEIQEKANAQLREAFAAWGQGAGIAAYFRIDHDQLHIQFEDRSEGARTAPGTFSSVAERSDGMRSFLALMAFAARHGIATRSTILLIDEAETHLHYDAQADLIQMFSRQRVAQQIIYTTHSAGCLPEDLGTGVRLVHAVSNGQSRFVNWFWASGDAGFSPLLFGMGASTLAFVPMRDAVISEGPTDMLLLPSLFREATHGDTVGFQVVPGLAVVDSSGLVALSKEGRRIVYLTDGDKGGRSLRQQLIDAGIEARRIFELPRQEGRDVTVEDYIAPDVYWRALTAVTKRYAAGASPPPLQRLPAVGRVAFVNSWYRERELEPPAKRDVAYQILEEGAIGPILWVRRSSSLERLHGRIARELSLQRSVSQ